VRLLQKTCPIQPNFEAPAPVQKKNNNDISKKNRKQGKRAPGQGIRFLKIVSLFLKAKLIIKKKFIFKKTQ